MVIPGDPCDTCGKDPDYCGHKQYTYQDYLKDKSNMAAEARFCPVCTAQVEFCDCVEQSMRPPTILDTSPKSKGEPFSAANWGYFRGQPITSWSPDGETMILMEDYTYVDPKTRSWVAGKGQRINGASIPRPFWTVVGSPYRGRYRLASIVHDAYCIGRSVGWQQTHFMFYQAMMAAGVDHLKAKYFYYAVYWFGPRWSGETAKKYPEKGPTRAQIRPVSPEMVEKVARFVGRNDPTIVEIEAVNPSLLGPH